MGEGTGLENQAPSTLHGNTKPLIRNDATDMLVELAQTFFSSSDDKNVSVCAATRGGASEAGRSVDTVRDWHRQTIDFLNAVARAMQVLQVTRETCQ